MYYIDGKFVNENEAKISILDLAILRGFGIFDYLRTYQGRPFHLWDHLLRLRYSAEHISLTLPNTLSEIEEIVMEVMRIRENVDASLKIVVTGGISTDQFTPQAKSSLIVFAYPLVELPESHYTDGIKVITTTLSRSLPTSKTTQYAPAIVAHRAGKNQNASEVLYVNPEQRILEGTTTNFFGVRGNTLFTCCNDEVLAGITREVVLRLASPHFHIDRNGIKLGEIDTLDEAFLTSSNREVMPIVQIDDKKIGNGKVGPHTQKLLELFRAYTEQEQWPHLNIPRYSRLAAQDA